MIDSNSNSNSCVLLLDSLCQPLRLYLKSNFQADDDVVRRRLTDLKSDIDAFLTRGGGTTKQCSALTTWGPPLLTSNKEKSERFSEASTFPTTTFVGSVSNALDVTTKSDKRRILVQGQTTTGALEYTDKVKLLRCNKKIVLLPILTRTELTTEESSMTVMAKLCGPNFDRWWQRWAAVIVFGKWTANIVAWAACFVTFFGPTSLVKATGMKTAIGLIFSISLLWLCLYFLSVMNLAVALRCARTYETSIFTLEMFLCAASLFILFGSQVDGLIVASGIWAGFCCVYLFYDSFPLLDRKRLRYSLLFNSIMFFILMGCVFFRAGDRIQLYRLDYYGLHTEQEDKKWTSSATDDDLPSRLSISIREFCLNRGITLSVLMLKLLYYAFHHPRDCVIIKSRVRVDELTRDLDINDARPAQSAGLIAAVLATKSCLSEPHQGRMK